MMVIYKLLFCFTLYEAVYVYLKEKKNNSLLLLPEESWHTNKRQHPEAGCLQGFLLWALFCPLKVSW